MAKTQSAVPRGFSRFYVLHLLKERPMNGKEIMDEAERRSGGLWRPSPGLIYPLLGRLLSENLIEEKDGKFTITPKGEEALQDAVKLQQQIELQVQTIKRLGMFAFTTSKLLVEEAMDRLTTLTTLILEDAKKLSQDTQRKFFTKYKDFLLGELERIEKAQHKTTEQPDKTANTHRESTDT